ncbi:hypothetical protein C7N43_08890 [Sphingobacteriales bacterium UPWRP_1]|nr:hypothetical protein BVG80_10995 [Sphingobacteriales bacterium TSM_CSM]PSJ77444.1 hypothetical protein C7N43_08890 [Sphingobacteriales bacterium UPWRP_1]
MNACFTFALQQKANNHATAGNIHQFLLFLLLSILSGNGGVMNNVCMPLHIYTKSPDRFRGFLLLSPERN